MNIAIIFAGGIGTRLQNSDIPKQFLIYDNKPIIIHTLEKFQSHQDIDKIIVVCLKDWLDRCQEYIKNFKIDKVEAIVEGGKTGQESIYNGLIKAYELFGIDNYALIHDGVRPLIDSSTISKCIESLNKYGNAITSIDNTETIFVEEKDGVRFIDRSLCKSARAPQCFKLEDIIKAHQKAKEDNLSFIDSAMLMSHYGYQLHLVKGKSENIKITTIADYYTFCALYELENGHK